MSIEQLNCDLWVYDVEEEFARLQAELVESKSLLKRSRKLIKAHCKNKSKDIRKILSDIDALLEKH